MPVLPGNAPSKRRKASKPPAEAPTPTIGKEPSVAGPASDDVTPRERDSRMLIAARLLACDDS
jgi:hypothetical protein